jgi:hypothetical protein
MIVEWKEELIPLLSREMKQTEPGINMKLKLSFFFISGVELCF